MLYIKLNKLLHIAQDFFGLSQGLKTEQNLIFLNILLNMLYAFVIYIPIVKTFLCILN